MWKVALAVLFVTGASASLVEDQTDGMVHYQADGGTEFDAPGSCAEADAMFQASFGNTTQGLLVPVDDEVDVYITHLDPSVVGTRVQVVAVPAATASIDIELFVHLPGCGLLTDPANSPQNITAPPPPGPGEKQVPLSNSGGACSDRWKFIMNQIDPLQAPASIHLRWSDGSTEDVPLKAVTPAGVAHYDTDTDTGFTLHDVHANVYAAWDGNFNIGERICGGAQGEFPDDPVVSQTSAEFTALVAGPYVLEVRLAGLQEPPTTIPVNCHVGCREGIDLLADAEGYSLTTDFKL